MLYIFWNICSFIATIGILITIHELGHFVAARLCGVTVQRFSIGFGYILWKYQDKKNTEYVISALPLGGYVKMLSKHDISEKDIAKYQTFEHKSVLKRGLIIAAGPIFNIIFAFLIYCFLFMTGISTCRPIISDIIPNSIIAQSKIPCNVEIYSINNVKTPDWESVRLTLIDQINHKEKNIIFCVNPLHTSQTKKYLIDLTNWKYQISTQDIITSLGIIPLSTHFIKPIISKIEKNSAGMYAGLKIGDEIISINHKLINTWDTFIREIQNNPDRILTISVKRKNQILTLQIKLDKITKNDNIAKYIGILPTYLPVTKEYTITHQLGLIQTIQKSQEKIFQIISLTWNMLYKLIIGDITLNNLGGPISIAQGAKEAAQNGSTSYLMFLSLISINLGIINLLPLPILDGGHLTLLIIEALAGEKISKKIEKYTYHIGIAILVLLTFLAIFNDISRI